MTRNKEKVYVWLIAFVVLSSHAMNFAEVNSCRALSISGILDAISNVGGFMGLDGTVEGSNEGSSKASKQRKFLQHRGVRYAIVAVMLVGVILILIISSNLHKKKPDTSNNAKVVNQYLEKLPALKKAVDKSPKDADARLAYADALYVTGDKKGARDQYLELITLSPKNGVAYNNLGNVYRDLGEYDAAVGAYSHAVEVQPSNQNAYINLANVQIYTLKRASDGIETYKKAIHNIGSTPQLLLLLGLAYEQAGDTNSATQTYQQILKDSPANASAKANLDRLNKSKL